MVQFVNIEDAAAHGTLKVNVTDASLIGFLGGSSIGFTGVIPYLRENSESALEKYFGLSMGELSELLNRHSQETHDGLRHKYIHVKNKFIRYHGALHGGAMSGMYFGSYFAVHNILAEKRGVEDVYNWMGASFAAGATLGLTYQRSPLDRVKLMISGTVLGAACAFPIRYVLSKQLDQLNHPC